MQSSTKPCPLHDIVGDSPAAVSGSVTQFEGRLSHIDPRGGGIKAKRRIFFILVSVKTKIYLKSGDLSRLPPPCPLCGPPEGRHGPLHSPQGSVT